MGNRSCYWAKLPARSPRERTALGKLAEGAGFEPAVRHRYAPWRLGGDSKQAKSRSKERLSDFLLLIQHLTWLRG
jgi:hypothetical protein